MTLHARVAMVFLAALPISTAFANVMMLTLVLAALLQGKAMRQVIASRLQTKFAMAAILFVAWNALSLLWSQDVPGGIEGLKAQRVLLLPLFWPYGKSTTWRFGLLLGTALAGLASLLAVAGLVLPGVEVLDGQVVPFQHPIVLGVLCAAGLVLALDAWGKATPGCRLALAIAAGLTLSALLLSGSRTGLLATLAAVPISLALMQRRVRTAALVGVALAAPIGLWQHETLQNRWSDAWQELSQWHESPETSVGWRVAALNAAWEVGTQSPWIGHGYGGVRSAVPADHPVRAQSERFSNNRVGTPLNLHNIWANAFARTGATGVVLLMGLYGSAASVVLRSESIHQSSGLGLLAVWGVLGLFDAGLGTGVTGAILALSLAGRERLK